jgi:hypothetical protein
MWLFQEKQISKKRICSKNCSEYQKAFSKQVLKSFSLAQNALSITILKRDSDYLKKNY